MAWLSLKDDGEHRAPVIELSVLRPKPTSTSANNLMSRIRRPNKTTRDQDPVALRCTFLSELNCKRRFIHSRYTSAACAGSTDEYKVSKARSSESPVSKYSEGLLPVANPDNSGVHYSLSNTWPTLRQG